jgi:hypothetical protein
MMAFATSTGLVAPTAKTFIFEGKMVLPDGECMLKIKKDGR